MPVHSKIGISKISGKVHIGTADIQYHNLAVQVLIVDMLDILSGVGNIVINNVVVPVIGFNIDNSIGRVSFMISPFFIIPDSMKFIENNPSGKLRNPTVVFDTNANTSHTFTSGGYIGDVSDKNSTNSNIFIMGYDINDGTMIADKRASYNLSMVDISIEIPDCSGLLNQLQWNTPFRYSGDFNRYTYDFTKNDYDTYPFPGVDRDVSDFNGSTSNIPSLTPESIIMCATDDKAPYVWSDSKPTDTFIAYSDTNVQ